MTVAAQQAAALGEALDRSGRLDRTFTRRYFKAASRVVNVAWSTAVGSDFAYDQTVGPKPPGTDLVNRYMERVIVAAQHDDAVSLRFNEVVAMVRRPEALLTPAFVLRVLRHQGRGRRQRKLGRDVAPAESGDAGGEEGGGDRREQQQGSEVELGGGHRRHVFER
jgi:hypothetical protein